MKANDYFKSMAEIEKFCESFRNQCTEEQYKTLKTVFGIGEQKGIFVELPNIGKIDISIANYIQALNDAGLTTLASCSGLAKDHPDSGKLKPGYISFVHTPLALEAVQAVAQKLNLNWQESETYLQPSIFVKIEGCSNQAKEHLWRIFFEAVMEELEKG